MAKYRKKHGEVEAFLLGTDQMPDWFVDNCTIDEWVRACSGYYIIKGVNGEFCPCKPDIFEKTYERVEEE